MGLLKIRHRQPKGGTAPYFLQGTYMKANIKRANKDDKVNLYTTPPWAIDALLATGELDDCTYPWEFCCGM